MRLLQRSFDVGTRFGGNFVQEIEGDLRRPRGRPAGRLVLLRERDRGVRRRRREAAAPGRPRVVRPPRLGGRRCASRPWSARSRSRSSPASTARSCRSGSSASGPRSRSCDEVETRLKRRRRAQHRALEPRVLARRGAADPRRPLARRAQGHHGPPARGGPGGVRRLRPAGRRPATEIALIDADGRVRAHARRRPPASWRRPATRRSSPTWLITGHRRRRRRGGRGGADRGSAPRPLRARDRGRAGGAAAARGPVSPLPRRPAAPRSAWRPGAWRSRRCRCAASTRRCWSRCSPSRRSPRWPPGSGANCGGRRRGACRSRSPWW